MPSPSPSPQPGPSPNAPSRSSAPQVPLNADGTPNLGAGAAPSGKTTIWNIPTGLDSSKPIWFDIGHNGPRAGAGGTEEGETHKNGPKYVPTSYEIMASPEDVMKQFMAMSKNDVGQFIQLQMALASGPFGHVSVTGSFDPATEAALGKAMFQYVKLSHGAGVGISFSDYLTQAAQTAYQLQQQQQGAKQAPQVNLSDPADIKATAQQAAMDALGQGLTSQQLDAFVAKFQAAQTANQTSTDSSTTAPILSSDAMAYAQQSNPDEFKQNQRQSYLSSLVNLLGGSLTSRPNQTPTPSIGGS